MSALTRLSKWMVIVLVIVLGLISRVPAQAKQLSGPMGPVWSPDGKQIALSMVRDHMTWGVYLLDLDSGKMTQLTEDGVPSGWSPDGRQIVYTGNQTPGIFVINKDGSQPTKVITNGYSPSWSPDGKTIRFIMDFAIATVPVNNKNGQGLQRLAEQKGRWLHEYEWSPDQKQVAFIGFEENNATAPNVIYLMDADGSNLRELAISTDAASVAWSPDGKSLATVSMCGDKEALCVWNVDGTNPRLLMQYGENPQWSPDSKQIAYVRGGKVCVINVDGSDAHCLTSDYRGEQVFWSPDGRQLLFTTMETIGMGDEMEIVTTLNLINIDGTGQRQLVP